MTTTSGRLGEVIEASSTSFIAQCHRLGEPPPLGALVKTTENGVDIYAVVHNASTGSIDPGRRFVALGRDEATEEDVYRTHPELSQLLRTDFEAQVVGHREGEALRQYLPPRPARIHAFVHLASGDEVRAFTGSLHFLPILANAQVPTRDDALAACLRLASEAHQDPMVFLVRAGKELANLLARDTQRLNNVLRQLKG